MATALPTATTPPTATALRPELCDPHQHPHRHATALPWTEARHRARRTGDRAPTRREDVPLIDAVGRVLAADLAALVPLPPHDAAAMDGWAVAGPPPWRVGAPIDAGRSADEPSLVPGTARPIGTGAVVPRGTDAVLRSEHGWTTGAADGGRPWDPGSSAVLLRPADTAPSGIPRRGDHIRPAGEEAACGEVLLQGGMVLTPPRVALAAAAGHDRLPVVGTPEVDLLILGDELAVRGTPRPGEVRDALGPGLPPMLRALGAGSVEIRRCPDDGAATTRAMAESEGHLLVVTGGSARGRTDHARRAAARIGVTLSVDGVAMRPGHPAGLGTRPDRRPVLLLPGNPFAAIVALLTLGGPLLQGMTGRHPSPLSRAPLATAVPDRVGTTRVVAVALDPDGQARSVDRQGSGMLRGLAGADALAVIEAGRGVEGSLVDLLPLPWWTATPIAGADTGQTGTRARNRLALRSRRYP